MRSIAIATALLLFLSGGVFAQDVPATAPPPAIPPRHPPIRPRRRPPMQHRPLWRRPATRP